MVTNEGLDVMEVEGIALNDGHKAEPSVFYHGSSALFRRFDLAHALEGDGKVKFGYGVYVTSCYRSAAHYAGANPAAREYFVYAVEVPAVNDENSIAFKKPVSAAIVRRAAEALGEAIPEKYVVDGKAFRKFLVRRLTGKVDFDGEKAASSFLSSIGVDFIVWPYSWRNPSLGTNMAVLNENRMRIIRVEQVELDQRMQLIEGSRRTINIEL